MAYKQLGDVLSALGYREQTKTAVCFFNIFCQQERTEKGLLKKKMSLNTTYFIWTPVLFNYFYQDNSYAQLHT